jgi:hypothetical protein
VTEGDRDAQGVRERLHAREERDSARLVNDRFSAAGPSTIEIQRGRFPCFAGYSPEILAQSKAVGQQTYRLLCADSVYRGNRRCRFAGTSNDGSDGTRTRDLRRDRPVLLPPGRAGIGGDSRRERDFQPSGCGDYREWAGASGALLRDEGGMWRCLAGERGRDVRARRSLFSS